MKRTLRKWAAAAAGFALAALAALPALAAPANPRVVGTATKVSGGDPSVLVTTTGAINGGDVIVVIAASELNMPPRDVNCWECFVSKFASSNNVAPWLSPQPVGKADQADLKTFVAYARKDLPIGTQIQAIFGGGAGAKSVTVVAISGATDYNLSPSGSSPVSYAGGTGTAIGWSCVTNCSMAANLMMLNASVISGGGSDSYTEDAGWTFLHQTAAGAWPTIRLAYKATGGGGTFSYGLTNGTSRSWYSGALLVK